MEDFIAFITSATGVLKRSPLTEHDYSLKDAAQLIRTIPHNVQLDLIETDRGNMRDIKFNLTGSNWRLEIKLIASEQFFVFLRSPLTVDGIKYRWVWNCNDNLFEFTGPEAYKSVFKSFLDAITEVL